METNLVFKKNLIYTVVFSIIVFMSTVRIEYLSHISSTITQIQNFSCVGLIVLLAFLLIFNKKVIINHIIYLFVVLTAVVLVSTLAGTGNISGFINEFSPMLVIGLMLELYQKEEEKLHVVLNTWKILLILFVFLDVLTEIRFPGGMYRSRLYEMNWLLGYKTQRFILVFPMIVIYLYMQIKKYGKLGVSCILIMLLGFIDCYLAEATGCTVSLAIFLLLFLIFSIMSRGKNIRAKKIAYALMNYKNFFAIFIVVFIVIVIIQNYSGLITFLFFLGKNSTFSGRTRIWLKVYNFIKNNLFLGGGYLNSEGFVRLTGMSTGTNAHNMILQLMVFGGLTALVLYVIIAIKAMRRKDQVYSLEEMVLVAGTYSFFILGLTSATMVISTFGLLTFWLLEYEKSHNQIAA